MRFGKPLPNNPRMPKDGGAVLFFRGYKSYLAMGEVPYRQGFVQGGPRGARVPN